MPIAPNVESPGPQKCGIDLLDIPPFGDVVTSRTLAA